MSSGGQMPAANRMTLQTFKARQVGAVKGHKLLKKKRDALKTKFHFIMKDIIEVKLAVGESLKDASYSLARANWATAGEDIAATVVERARKPSVLCKLTADNIAGVSIPVFKQLDCGQDTSIETLGLSNGGAVIQVCRETYRASVLSLIKLASLQTAFKTLDEEIKMTSRRVNALEYVLIPRIEDIIAYIIQQMDEESREEFFRVKKVVEKKKQKIEKEKLVAAKELAARGGVAEKSFSEALAAMNAPSALESTKDEDVIF